MSGWVKVVSAVAAGFVLLQLLALLVVAIGEFYRWVGGWAVMKTVLLVGLTPMCLGAVVLIVLGIGLALASRAM